MKKIIKIRELWIAAILLFLIASSVNFSSAMKQLYVQEGEEFSVTVSDEEINVALVDSTGAEKFGVTILKNGGINDLRIAQLTFAYGGGWFIWTDDWGQTSGSVATEEPIIEETDNYVSVTCFSRYQVHPLGIVTKIIVSKAGIIFIDTNLTAVEDATGVTQIAWGFWGFPASLFGGSKAYVSVEGTGVQEVDLPAEHAQGASSLYDNTQTAYWIDFSTPTEGVTVVNLASPFYVSYAIGDEREWGGVEFSVQFRHTDWGQGAMNKGEMKIAKIAIYIHGPGGYENSKDMIDLLSDLGKSEGSVSNAIVSYKDPTAKSLATQALAKVRSVYDKIAAGDTSGARSLLSESSSLMEQADGAERNAQIMHDIYPLIVLAIIAVILVVIIVIRRRT